MRGRARFHGPVAVIDVTISDLTRQFYDIPIYLVAGKVGWSVHPLIHPLVRETRGEIKTKQTGDSKRSIEGKIY